MSDAAGETRQGRLLPCKSLNSRLEARRRPGKSTAIWEIRVQDEIAEAVAGAIEPELLKTESQRGAARPQSMEAWDLVRRGMWEFHKIEPEGHRLARELFLKAIEADPNSADGYIWLARAEAGLAAYGWTDHSEAIRQAGMV